MQGHRLNNFHEILTRQIAGIRFRFRERRFLFMVQEKMSTPTFSITMPL